MRLIVTFALLRALIVSTFSPQTLVGELTSRGG